ncbi:MAG: rod shape-determining protein MreC [Thermaurantiacus sp.]
MRGPASVGTRLRPARRSSFARRESNLRLIAALLTGGVIAFALFLLLLQRVDPEQAGRIRGAGADVLAPVHALVSAPVRIMQRAADQVGDHFRTVERLRTAEAELEQARRRAAEADTLAAEVRRLEGLLGMQRPERRVVATARVSAAPAHAASQTAIIGAGLSHGVQPQMPVLAADGLAGRVTDVGLAAARILLLTDAASRVPVRVQRTGWTGLAVGTGGRLVEFQTDMSGLERIRPGDMLVTSGDGGIFPPGIPVAVIVDAEASPPRARPLANPAGLGIVSVEASWLPPPSFVPAPAAVPEPDREPPPASEEPAA